MLAVTKNDLQGDDFFMCFSRPLLGRYMRDLMFVSSALTLGVRDCRFEVLKSRKYFFPRDTET